MSGIQMMVLGSGGGGLPVATAVQYLVVAGGGGGGSDGGGGAGRGPAAPAARHPRGFAAQAVIVEVEREREGKTRESGERKGTVKTKNKKKANFFPPPSCCFNFQSV